VLGHVDRNSSCAREISHSLEGRCVVVLIFEREWVAWVPRRSIAYLYHLAKGNPEIIGDDV
jgi:hypothetical protein